MLAVQQQGRAQQQTLWRSCWRLLLQGHLVWVVLQARARLLLVWASMRRKLQQQQAWRRVRLQVPGCRVELL